jgi:molecular chaperone DnaJ
MTEAILGSSKKVETLTGKVDVKIKPGTTHDTQLKLQGLGVPKLPPNQTQRGDHVVTVKIAMPKKLSEA